MPWWMVMIAAVGLVAWFFRFLQTGHWPLLLLGIVWPAAALYGYWHIGTSIARSKRQARVPNCANSVSIESRIDTEQSRK
jgi:hypothetical protein